MGQEEDKRESINTLMLKFNFHSVPMIDFSFNPIEIQTLGFKPMNFRPQTGICSPKHQQNYNMPPRKPYRHGKQSFYHITVGGDKVSMLIHTYPHKPLKED